MSYKSKFTGKEIDNKLDKIHNTQTPIPTIKIRGDISTAQVVELATSYDGAYLVQVVHEEYGAVLCGIGVYDDGIYVAPEYPTAKSGFDISLIKDGDEYYVDEIAGYPINSYPDCKYFFGLSESFLSNPMEAQSYTITTNFRERDGYSDGFIPIGSRGYLGRIVFEGPDFTVIWYVPEKNMTYRADFTFDSELNVWDLWDVQSVPLGYIQGDTFATYSNVEWINGNLVIDWDTTELNRANGRPNAPLKPTDCMNVWLRWNTTDGSSHSGTLLKCQTIKEPANYAYAHAYAHFVDAEGGTSAIITWPDYQYDNAQYSIREV